MMKNPIFDLESGGLTYTWVNMVFLIIVYIWKIIYLIAQLVEHFSGIAEVMGLNPVQAWMINHKFIFNTYHYYYYHHFLLGLSYTVSHDCAVAVDHIQNNDVFLFWRGLGRTIKKKIISLQRRLGKRCSLLLDFQNLKLLKKLIECVMKWKIKMTIQFSQFLI